MALKKAKTLVGFHTATDMPQKQKTANGFAGSATQIGADRPLASIPNALVHGLPSTDLTAFARILSGPGKIEANRSPAWVLHRHKQDLEQDPGLGARVPSEIF
jgi:hypothetical protein